MTYRNGTCQPPVGDFSTIGAEMSARRRSDVKVWRAICLCCAFLLCLSGVARAEMLMVGWAPNAEHENVAGYLVSYGSVSRTEKDFRGYEVNVDVGPVTRYAIEEPPHGPLYISIRAYNNLGQVSDFSDEIVLDRPRQPLTGEGSPRGGAKPDSSPGWKPLGVSGPGVSSEAEQGSKMNESFSTKRSTREKVHEIAELERKRDALLRTLTPKHPDVRALQRQLDRLRREVDSSP